MFFRVVLPIALPGVMSAALFAFLASFDELLISLFLAGVRAQTLPVRIWNSLNLQVEPTIAAVSAFLIAVTCADPGRRWHPAPSARTAAPARGDLKKDSPRDGFVAALLARTAVSLRAKRSNLVLAPSI